MIEQEPTSFVMVDSPSFTFQAPEVAVRTDNGIVELRPRAGNDNLSLGRSRLWRELARWWRRWRRRS